MYIEIVRQLLRANRSGPPEETIEAVLALCDPACEFTSRITAVEGGDYRGHEGARAYFRDMVDSWREWRNEADRIAEVGPGAVLVDNVFTGVGRDSGAPVTMRSTIVFVFSGRRVVRCVSCPTREEALRAAGISP